MVSRLFSVKKGVVISDQGFMVACGGLFVLIAVLIMWLPSPHDFTPPSVGFSYPDEDQTVQGVIDIGINASDSSGIERVELSLNCSGVIARFSGPPFTTVWDTSPLAVNRYTLCVTAWDKAGLSSRVTREVSVVR